MLAPGEFIPGGDAQVELAPQGVDYAKTMRDPPNAAGFQKHSNNVTAAKRSTGSAYTRTDRERGIRFHQPRSRGSSWGG